MIREAGQRIVGAGLGFGPSAPAVGYLLGVARAAGDCATEERGRTVPHEQLKWDFTPYRAGSAAPDDSGGFWDKGRKARLRDTAAPTKLFAF